MSSNFMSTTKMSRVLMTADKKTHIAARYEVWGSIVKVQRWFRSIFGVNNTIRPNTIKKYHKKLFETGCASNSKRPNRQPSTRTQDNIHAVKQVFDETPDASIRTVSSQLSCGKRYTH